MVDSLPSSESFNLWHVHIANGTLALGYVPGNPMMAFALDNGSTQDALGHPRPLSYEEYFLKEKYC